MNEADPYLPAPAASQAIAARTLQRSQGQSQGAPPDTPPPSYAHAASLRPPPMHVSPTAPLHEAEFLLPYTFIFFLISLLFRFLERARFVLVA